MLPELNAKLEKSHEKKKKKKKDKKEKKKSDKKGKKSKKQKKDGSSDSDSSDEWVEKTPTPSGAPVSQSPAVQRDDWMTLPSLMPTFSSKDLLAQKRTSLVSEEEAARKKAMELPGQSSRELNPYWKDGGTGLPPERKASSIRQNEEEKPLDRRNRRSRSPDSRRDSRKRSHQVKSRFRRPSSDSDGESKSSAPVKSYASSQPGWKKTVPRHRSPSPSSSSSSSRSSSSVDDERGGAEKRNTVAISNASADEKIWSEQELNALNAKIIKAEIMGQQVASCVQVSLLAVCIFVSYTFDCRIWSSR